MAQLFTTTDCRYPMSMAQVGRGQAASNLQNRECVKARQTRRGDGSLDYEGEVINGSYLPARRPVFCAVDEGSTKKPRIDDDLASASSFWGGSY